MNPDKTIRIAAAIIMDEQDRMLLVRKRGTPFFMQPGGKIESTESSVTALIRELSEELQIQIVEQDTHFVGQFMDVAANEPGCTLIAEIFLVRAYTGTLAPAAEIEEIVWYHPAKDAPLMLAPLTGKQIIPLMLEGLTRPA
ncbi:NUDIX hydrolase [Pantoea rodasii]|nr:NUDIX domain-containing protein [Pantoea rodasii]